jgi:Arc/MetJ-type ribon-helix-helix transcriptional regulator
MFMGEHVNFRMNQEQAVMVGLLIKKYPDRYKSPSHFVRCAVIQLINKHVAEDNQERGRVRGG